METYGWPIKYFTDIPELFRVIIDAILGMLYYRLFGFGYSELKCRSAHRFLYYRGILHRDVSLGNILICPNGADVEMTTGCLIDLDHAKIDLKYVDKEKIVSGPEPLTAKLDERIRKARPAMSSMIQDDFHPAGIDEEALFALLIQFETKGDALTYVDYICKQKSSLRRDQPVSNLYLHFHGTSSDIISATAYLR
jgi:serine/threonine protein kinase